MAKRRRTAAERAAQAESLRRRPARARILEAARKLISSRGYERLRVGELADAAGVSRETFYTHFADKRACLAEATAPELGEVEVRLRAAQEAGQPWAGPILASIEEQLAAHFGARSGPREQILDAMLEQLKTRGYAATRLSDVISGAHVSYPAFYRHFESKEACARATVAALVERLERRVAASAATLAEGGDPSLSARARLEALLGIFAAEPATARVLLVEAGRAPAPRTDGDDSHTSATTGLLANLLLGTGPGTRGPEDAFAVGAVLEVLRSGALGDGTADPPSVAAGLVRLLEPVIALGPAQRQPLAQPRARSRRPGQGRSARRLAVAG